MINTEILMQKAIAFHGHRCSGLAIGVLVSKYILEQGNDFSIDEELVTIVETNSCGVDAIQALLGTTFGKGNLIHLDYGKNNYTIYNRESKKAVNIRLKRSNNQQDILSRKERIEYLINSDPKDIFRIKEIDFNPPNKAQIFDRITCEKCQDPTMSTRIKKYKDKNLCIPCHQELLKENK
ncbi:MAG: formylmethanofuran dehydrogenase [Candidatus Lokiarchaeota archaeon]|nr:formylmethanofuran dehydrogenase [Candidatus Lokiarchaeota archaeon]